MKNQTVTVYHRIRENGSVQYERQVLSGVHLVRRLVETPGRNGETGTASSTLQIFSMNPALSAGDFVVEGECAVESFAGNPGGNLPPDALRVEEVRTYPFGRLAHQTLILR